MKLDGLRVAALVADGFEQVELTDPMRALRDAGAHVTVVSPNDDKVQGMNHGEKGDRLDVDAKLSGVSADDYDALLLPGGVKNPDLLRQDERAVRFVRTFFDAGKPIASICHGPWLLVEADVVRGRRLTSYPSLRTDIRNAGGEWVDEEVVVDHGMVTSRNPDDLPAFNAKMVEEFGEGIHERRPAATGGAATR
ncbi:MAG: type 1 glutamine amidotransferase domain-containing protein [Candidatus Limnocylindria bacterium]